MIQSPQSIRVIRGGAAGEAMVAWRYEQGRCLVEITSAEFVPVKAEGNDAFEALCLVREPLEALGWLVGVAGAQVDVWPSGMARDQGGGLSAYKLSTSGGESVVDTFAPVDPAMVTTLADQRAHVDRLMN